MELHKNTVSINNYAKRLYDDDRTLTKVIKVTSLEDVMSLGIIKTNDTDTSAKKDMEYDDEF